MKKKISVLILTLSAFLAVGQVRLANVFSDHMVLQQQSEVTIWGWANPLEKISIRASWSNDTIRLQTPNSASWSTKIKTPNAGGPYSITVKGYNEITLNDVMIGEVWICSGQSNMEWSVNNGTEDAKADLPNANIPTLRLFQVGKSSSEFPQIRGEGKWEVCSPEAMKGFSSVGYFFGKKLITDLSIPIGLINISWGATPAEVWLPKEKVETDEALNTSYKMLKEVPWCTSKAGAAYNSMVHPIIPFSIAGALWYQGESNTVSPFTYKKLMTNLIASWRSDFGKDFPFYFVQIAPYAYGRANEGVLIREQQSKLLEVKNTGMVVISDKVDDVNNIHPKFKKPVGERLANLALAEVYKKPIAGYKSPTYKNSSVEKSRVRIYFENADGGLVSQGGTPKEFEIAGEDKKFYPANAKIEGSTVVVWSKEVSVPVAVRYCWGNTLIGNLFSKELLPVSSFRSDEWDIELSPAGGKK